MSKYKSILATLCHNPVTKMSDFRHWDEFQMGFYLGNEVIGSGSLKRPVHARRNPKYLQTESVSLNRKYQRKGHGIHLYLALINHAKKCGAKRIYSSTHLNKFSRRMWSEKLAKYYKVKEYKNKKQCLDCGCNASYHHRGALGYYIEL